MSKNLSRRDFLKLTGMVSAGLALSACGENIIELPTSSATTAITPSATAMPLATATPPATVMPTIMPGMGRLMLEFYSTPNELKVRMINDKFLIGIGAATSSGCAPSNILRDLRLNGINLFRVWTAWGVIERQEGNYSGVPCPDESFIEYAYETGAFLDGCGTLFLLGGPYIVPDFVSNRPFEEQKRMAENFIRAVVQRFPHITSWTLNEPIAQNVLGLSREQNYDLFVSASHWIHETNPDAKVLINMIPIPVDWSSLHYDPNRVMDDMLSRGLEADIIGIEIYSLWEGSYQDKNGCPRLDWVGQRIEIFRRYGLPILFSEVGVPGIMNNVEQLNKQADWLEAFLRLAHNDPDVIGATWWFTQDEDEYIPDVGLTNDDNTFRPVAKRMFKLAEEWNPSIVRVLNGQNYLELEPGEYDVIFDKHIFRVNIRAGETFVITAH